ncbi:MAG: asparagine synthase B [Firmicutes bacterium]|nr:asparagine synthase B [Bacillota bacterium]
MCGIAGMVGAQAPGQGHEAQARFMLKRMPWRGPDGEGVRRGRNWVIGHNRLAIIDLATGNQPVANETEDVWAAVNGEIYNFRRLRQELLERGHRFRTQSDSEVVVHLFEEEGPALVRRLDGMFALAVGYPGGVLLARDPLGIRPLYYGHTGKDELWFASELKAILPVCPDAEEFPAGHYFSRETGVVPFYALPRPYDGETDERAAQEEAAIQLIQEKLEAAVEKRLVADVPVGVFLSGGLDSSLIAAIARRKTSGVLHSFAVGMEGSPDLEFARRAAAAIGTEHHEHQYTQDDVQRVLPSVIYHLESHDPALIRSSVATYFAARLAAKKVKVILTGEGADELFAGYEYLRAMPLQAINNELTELLRNLHNTNLQRGDRLTMAASLEARVPFLDLELVAAALALPASLKLPRDASPGRPTEKYLLRRIAAGYLPSEIAWRRKEKFSQGTGTASVLMQLADEQVSEADFRRETALYPEAKLASREEVLYYRVFRRYFPGRGPLKTVGRTRSVVPGEIKNEAV